MTRLITPRRFALFASALAAMALAAPERASACGGFFCDSSQPVNQQAERIVFAQEADGSVTAVIQIQYQGPSERFAWMLPVAGSPEISVSSDAAFQRLQQASNPQYRLTTRVEGTCGGGPSRAFDSAGSPGASADGGAADAGAPPVSVVDSGYVGPYDYIIISVDPSTPDVAETGIAWLQDNGYDVPSMGAEVLRPYLESGMNLLAFRLVKGNDAGSIRPVSLSFGPGLPSIPLRPTALATQPDMGILVWVLGPSRAIPANYRDLELNEALINWLSPGSTYDAVVTRAANEAGGQGFVTEMAGAAAPLADVIWSEDEAARWAALRAETWTGREGELVFRIAELAALDGVPGVLTAALTIPDGVSEDQFFACLGCYVDASEADLPGVEPAALLDAVQADVIDPMVDTRALFIESPYMTRLYTTMSADEMTVDPIFDFNDTLGDYSNVHEAERIIECSPSISQFEAPWRVELDADTTVRGRGNTWPFDPDGGAMPANARVRRIGNTGEGEVIEDNTAAIAATLVEHNASVPGAPPASASGCSASAASSRSALGFGFALAFGLGFFLLRRRD